MNGVRRVLWSSCVTVLCALGCRAQERVAVVREMRSSGEPVLTLTSDDALRDSDASMALFSGENVTLLESSTFELHAFRVVDGSKAWTVGRRGSGPGEFTMPSSFFPMIGDEVGVIDQLQRRITFVRADGTFGGSVSTAPLNENVTNACDVGGGAFVVVTALSNQIIRLDSAGTVQWKRALQWPDDDGRAPAFFGQGIFASSRGGRCVLFSPRGNHFVEVNAEDGAFSAFHRYVDTYVFPPVVMKGRWPTLAQDRTAASAAAVSGSLLYVLVGDASPDNGRTIDVYSLGSGAYQRSYQLPERAGFIDVRNDTLLTIGRGEDGSRLRIYALSASR